MASMMIIKTEPEDLQSVHQMCRLCLSEDSLEDLFQEQDLQQWILEVLSIPVSSEDGMSQAICAICRIRVTEFHQYRLRCQEVQDVLKSMAQKVNEHKEHHEEPEHEHPVDVEDMIHIEQIKIEDRTLCDTEPPVVLPDKPPASLRRSDRTKKINENVINSSQAAHESVERVSEKEISGNEESFRCNVCRKPCQSKKMLWNHKRIVHGPKKYVCQTCNLGFSAITNLERHKRSHSHVKKLQEVSANQKLSSEDAPRGHLLNGKDGDFTDNSKISLGRQTVQTNEDVTDGLRPVKCIECHKTFKSKNNLYGHFRTVHGPKRAECHTCGIGFSDRTDLNRHELTKKHLDKLQQSSVNLEVPVEDAPSGDLDDSDSLECDICHKTFKEKAKLDLHMEWERLKRHMAGTQDPPHEPTEPEDLEVRPFKCDICQKAFKLKTTVQGHRLKVHGPKIHECRQCGTKFSTRPHLRRHVKIHNR